MNTISSIAQRVQQRLEEIAGSSGIFWDYTNEILPAVVEAMNEASLLTGVVQVAQAANITLPANTTYFSLPANVVALLTVSGPPIVQKTSVYALDQMSPGWQNVGGTKVWTNLTTLSRTANVTTANTSVAHGFSLGTRVDVAGVADHTYNAGQTPILSVPATTSFTYANVGPNGSSTGGVVNNSATPPIQQIQNWFPMGVNMYGIYPQLAVAQQVKITYLAYPVTVSTPYTGNETVPFQQEFQDALEQYVVHVLRLKEAGYEWQASQTTYQQYLDTMRELTKFQARHDSLVFQTAVGAKIRVNPVEVR